MLKDRTGIPSTVEGKLALAARAVAAAAKAGIDRQRLCIDPVFAPLAVSADGMSLTLEAVRQLSRQFPECHRIGGLSNISFGLPERKLVNRTFAAMAIQSGISALICDTSDHELMKSISAAEALAGRDPGCRRFLAKSKDRRRPR